VHDSLLSEGSEREVFVVYVPNVCGSSKLDLPVAWMRGSGRENPWATDAGSSLDAHPIPRDYFVLDECSVVCPKPREAPTFVKASGSGT